MNFQIPCSLCWNLWNKFCLTLQQPRSPRHNYINNDTSNFLRKETQSPCFSSNDRSIQWTQGSQISKLGHMFSHKAIDGRLFSTDRLHRTGRSSRNYTIGWAVRRWWWSPTFTNLDKDDLSWRPRRLSNLSAIVYCINRINLVFRIRQKF